MTNFKIRAKRTNDGAGCAPEYAGNLLSVDIDFGNTLAYVKELSINIYTSYFLLMASDAVSLIQRRKRKRISFLLASPYEWTDGTYHVLVYRNGVLHSIAKLILPYADVTAYATLERTNFSSAEEYFDTLVDEEPKEDNEESYSLFDDFLANMERSRNDNERCETAGTEAKATSRDTEPSVPAVEQLNRMIGLKRLKAEIHDASLMAMFAKKRRDLQLDTTHECRNHMLFLGGPGTGKTTVAKLIGMIYHEMGLLSVGHTIETNRSKLVGEYIGQTENRMVSTIKEARGGVLFIDEAYTLIDNDDNQRDFGKQVVNSLLTVLSEPNPDMIVIMAGYEDKMQTLLQSNPGLKERFPLRFHFDNYTADELMEIATYELSQQNFTLTPAAEHALTKLIVDSMRPNDKHFGNARWVKNLINHGVIKSMAKRVMSMSCVEDEKLLFSTIEECDIEEAGQWIAEERPQPIPMRRIGFAV